MWKWKLKSNFRQPERLIYLIDNEIATSATHSRNDEYIISGSLNIRNKNEYLVKIFNYRRVGCGDFWNCQKKWSFGALFSSLPLMTLLILFWLFFEKQPQDKIANHAYYTFWYVVGTLPFFLIFPFLLPKMGFVLSLSVSVVLTLIIFYVYCLLVKQFGIVLL